MKFIFFTFFVRKKEFVIRYWFFGGLVHRPLPRAPEVLLIAIDNEYTLSELGMFATNLLALHSMLYENVMKCVQQ